MGLEYIIVQAGGRGSRLGHLTKNKPKALVPVDNRPMLFHLFYRYPEKRFIIIADYKKEVMREYLQAFATVKYGIVDADGSGTCAGLKQAIDIIPERKPFMLIWSDLILPHNFSLPEEYEGKDMWPEHDYIGIAKSFPCRWSYINGAFSEKESCEYGVAGFFLFTGKDKLARVPEKGELVRWMQTEGKLFQELSLEGTREFGLLEEYQKMKTEKCRPFNRIRIEGDVLIKEAVDAQGEELARKECAWYEMARGLQGSVLPKIYGTNPLRMEYIKGKNIYEYEFAYAEKRKILRMLVSELHKLHSMGQIAADYFSLKEAYYRKTIDRISKIEDMIPFGREREIRINGKICRNVFYHKQELEKRLEQIPCDCFHFIHGDCTFSNLLLREDGMPVLIDPRGYFGYTEFYGDIRYDWAKLYYSIVGNYDRFNLKEFKLDISEEGIQLDIASNHWEELKEDFFELTGADEGEIKLLHAVIWLSLTTYAWHDYDSVCGAFYNGLYYLEEAMRE